jgi:uncharacterized membrane protein YhhN
VANPFLIVSMTSSLLYCVTQHWQPFPGSILLKGLSVSPLALWAWTKLKTGDGGRLGAALAFGSLGDVLLDMSPGMFPAGLGAFLVGHLLYIWLFLSNRSRPLLLSSGEKALIGGLVVFAAVMAAWLVPAVGPLAPAVVAYMAALVGVVIAATLLQGNPRWLLIGAILFLVSDSILAVNKFKMPVPGREFLIWPTYYLGQLGIALGFLRAKGLR